MRKEIGRFLVVAFVVALLPNAAFAAIDQSSPEKAYSSLLEVYKNGDTAAYVSLLQPSEQEAVKESLKDEATKKKLEESLKAAYERLKDKAVDKVTVDAQKATISLVGTTEVVDFVSVNNVWCFVPPKAAPSAEGTIN